MTVLKKVMYFLREKPTLRNSDKLLLLNYWHTQGFHLTEEQRQIFMNKCTTPETITRARRELREQYPESKEVQQERFNKFLEHKNNKAISWLED